MVVVGALEVDDRHEVVVVIVVVDRVIVVGFTVVDVVESGLGRVPQSTAYS
jgi:hypothetical protein